MESNFLKLVGDRIRTLRKEKGLTQEVLAEKANIHFTYISDIERGERNISLETLEKIVLALGLEPVQIFQFDHIESIEESKSKVELISAFNSLLAARSPQEIRMLLSIFKEIIRTYHPD